LTTEVTEPTEPIKKFLQSLASSALKRRISSQALEADVKAWLAAGSIALLALLSPALSQPLSAQWPLYTREAQKTPDGQPSLTAPAPRTASGRPDLSGVWENPGWRELGAASVSGTGGAPGRPALQRGPGLFFDLASDVSGGLPLQPWAADLKKKRMADNNKDNPDAHCLPMGNMQLHTHPEPRKIVQSPDVIVILYEGNSGIRQIFTDGRSLPNNDPQPWWYGYSVGTWEGDTLVVETIGFRDGGWLDVNGSPLTEAAKMTERFHRVNYGSMEIDVTIDDKKAYTKPWSVKVNHRLMPGAELIEFVCAENEKDARHYEK
jgi:hypothetical protein